MIWAIVNIFIVYWFYVSAVDAGKKNPINWAIIGGVVFLAVEVLWVNMVPVFSSREINLDRSDRDTSFLFNMFMELSPAIVGLVVAAAIRAKFLLKEKITLSTLFDFKSKKE